MAKRSLIDPVATPTGEALVAIDVGEWRNARARLSSPTQRWRAAAGLWTRKGANL